MPDESNSGVVMQPKSKYERVEFVGRSRDYTKTDRGLDAWIAELRTAPARYRQRWRSCGGRARRKSCATGRQRDGKLLDDH